METLIRPLRTALPKFIWRASFPRTLVETVILGFFLSLLSALFYRASFFSLYILILLFFVSPLCAFYYGLRLRPPQGRKVHWFAIEALRLAIIGTVSIVLVFVASVFAGNHWDLQTLWAYALIWGAFIFSWVFFRVIFHVIWIFHCLGQRYLLWSLMNSHLITVVLLQSVVILPLMFFLVVNEQGFISGYLENDPIASGFYRVNMMLPFLGLAILGSLVILLILLPASAVVSYFFARRIKHRLDALVTAANKAGAGDYQTRVEVTGEDEITRLQTNFNNMIVSLEANVNELRAEREKVADLLKLRHELIANVSHELRTPLATMRAYLEIAQNQQQEGRVILSAGEMENLQHEAEVLQTLIDDLFALSRAETDHLEIYMEAVAVATVAERVVETIAPIAWQNQRVEINTQVPRWLPYIHVDANRLEQTLRNLIHNSLRHTLPGGVIILSAEVEADHVAIHVRDTGEGIAEEDIPLIWERFYRGRKNGGTGLGLAIVKAFTEGMNGTVSVTSQRGEGSCFTLRFPVNHMPQEPSSTADEALPKPIPVSHKQARNSH